MTHAHDNLTVGSHAATSKPDTPTAEMKQPVFDNIRAKWDRLIPVHMIAAAVLAASALSPSAPAVAAPNGDASAASTSGAILVGDRNWDKNRNWENYATRDRRHHRKHGDDRANRDNHHGSYSWDHRRQDDRKRGNHYDWNRGNHYGWNTGNGNPYGWNNGKDNKGNRYEGRWFGTRTDSRTEHNK